MKTLNPLPDAKQYTKLMGQKVLLGKKVVTVTNYSTETRQGSYERGLKWSRSEYGMLRWELKGTKYYKPKRFSLDHGKTWHDSVREAKRTRKGRVKLNGQTESELAFEGIQRINRSYDPSFRWSR